MFLGERWREDGSKNNRRGRENMRRKDGKKKIGGEKKVKRGAEKTN